MTEQVEQKTRTNVALKYPPRYDVIIFNDDFTPVEFVIKLLVEIFNKNLKSAKDLTLEIHESGSAVAGTYSYEIAELKCAEGTPVARGQGHPLPLIVNLVDV